MRLSVMGKSISKTAIWCCTVLICASLVTFSAERKALAQAGSTGGTVGKIDKSISGATEPEPPPAKPHKATPQKAEPARRAAPKTQPAAAARDGTTRCPLPQGSWSSAAETWGCALSQNATTYARCVSYGHAHGYSQAEIDTYCTLLPR
jgi:hypothetical protein